MRKEVLKSLPTAWATGYNKIRAVLTPSTVISVKVTPVNPII